MKKALSLVLAVLMIAALLGMMHFLKDVPDQETLNSLAYATTPLPLRVLIDQEEKSVVKVTIDYDGTCQTYVYDARTRTYGAENYDSRLAFDQAALEKLFDSCARLVSRKVIDDKPEDMAIYGMDSPDCTITATYTDDGSHVIRIGGRSPLGDGYFGMIDDDPAIYLLLSYDVDSFLKKPYDYRSYTLFHDLGEDMETYSLTVRELLMERRGKERILLQRQPNGADGEVYTIQIKEPVVMNGDEYAFYQKVIQPIFGLKNAKLRLVEDLPSDLSRYGLEEPQTLWVRDDGGATRLLIGKEEEGYAYVMREGVPAVLSVKASALSFLQLDYAQVMDRLVWLFNIDAVSSLTVQRAERTDTLSVIDDGAAFRFNGTAVDAEVARALYRSAISLQFDNRVEKSAVGTPPECTLILKMKDGKEHTVSLHELNERHLEVARDGVSTGFYVNKSDLQNILSTLEALYKLE